MSEKIETLEEIKRLLKEFKDLYISNFETIPSLSETVSEACERIRHSWSGSYLGWHGTIYYRDFQIPINCPKFSIELGGTRGIPPGWKEKQPEEVLAKLEELIGNNFSAKQFEKKIKTIREEAIKFKNAIVIKLYSFNFNDHKAQEKTVFEQLENFSFGPTKNDYIEKKYSAEGEVYTRDIDASNQGRYIPGWLKYEALALEGKNLCEAVNNFIYLSNKLVIQLETANKSTSAISMSEGYPLSTRIYSPSNQNQKSIFISHSSLNKQIIDWFVNDLLHGAMEFKRDDIFYTSGEGTKISPGRKWEEVIDYKLTTAKVVFLIITPEYNASEVCLKEQTVALDRKDCSVFPLIVEPITISSINGCVKERQLEKLNDALGLERIKDELIKIFNLGANEIKSDLWSKKKEEFLEKINNFLHNDYSISFNASKILDIDVKEKRLVKLFSADHHSQDTKEILIELGIKVYNSNETPATLKNIILNKSGDSSKFEWVVRPNGTIYYKNGYSSGQLIRGEWQKTSPQTLIRWESKDIKNILVYFSSKEIHPNSVSGSYELELQLGDFSGVANFYISEQEII